MGRPTERGHIYFVSPRPLPWSGNVPKWQNICPGSLPVWYDLRILADRKSDRLMLTAADCEHRSLHYPDFK